MSRKNKRPLPVTAKPATVLSSPMTSKWVGPLLLVWAAVVFFFYAKRQSVLPFQAMLTVLDQMSAIGLFHSYALQMLLGVGVALGLAGLAFQIGNYFLARLFDQRNTTLPERWSLGCALGFGVLSFMPFLLGAMRLWNVGVFVGVLGVASLFFVVLHPTPWFRVEGSAPHSPVPWRRVWTGILMAFFFLIFLGDLTPEVFYDTLYYHIAVPNLYQIAGRVFDIPTMLFSNFVLTVQWLFGLAMALGGEIAAKVTHGITAVLIVVTFIAAERRYLSAGAGWIGAVLFISTPIVGINAITTGTDVAWSFVQVAASLAFIQALLSPSRNGWILSGLLTGLAASCKYPGLPFIPIALVLLVWKRKRTDAMSWPTVLSEAFLFGACATAVTLPFLIRNVIFHGNPLYPFGGTHFGHPRIDPHYWDIFIRDAHSRHLSQEFSSPAAFFRYLFHPWHITMTGNDNGSWMGPLYLLFLPLLFLVKAPSQGFLWLRRHTAILWVLWMLTTETPRYGMPTLAMASLLMGESVLHGIQSSWVRAVLFCAIAWGSFSNFRGLLAVIFQQQGWRVVGGKLTEKEYLSEMTASYPTPPYTAYDWMNNHLPKDAVVLIAGEARSHYLRRRSVPSSVPDPQPLVVYAASSASGAEMAERIRRDGITHLFLNMAEAVRTEGYGLFPFDAASWATLEDFWKRSVELIWKEERFDRGNPKVLYVYRVLSPEETEKKHEIPANPFERWKPNPVKP